MKIASWNVNSLKVRLPHLRDWLGQAGPDIMALQETKLEDDKFPHAEIAECGYRSVCSGQKTYNGVALLARDEPREVLTDIPGLDDPQRRIIAASFGEAGNELRVVNLYVVNGQEVGSEKFAYKLDWLSKVTAFLRDEIRRYPRLVVLGDFNIAPEDRDVHDPDSWRDKVLCSIPERNALKSMLDLGLHDSYRLFESEAGKYSWWDYRQAAFRRNLGLRIDLILAADALRDRCISAGIDREPRTWERPSDHTPVVLELSNA